MWTHSSPLWDQRQKLDEENGQWLFILLFCLQEFTEPVTMAFLLMFVTLLHLVTLAMAFIATMEKVGSFLHRENVQSIICSITGHGKYGGMVSNMPFWECKCCRTNGS